MFSLLNPGRWGLYLAFIVVLVLGYMAWESHIRADEHAKVVAEYNIKIDALKAAAKADLDTEKAKTDAKEKAWQTAKDQQENTDVINEQTISLLADKLHRLAGQSGGVLIDPNAARCGSSGSSPTAATPSTASSSPANPTQTSGVLSVPLTELLFSITREADTVNNAYESCRSMLIAERK